MTEQDKADSETAAVRSLHYTGNPEMDHLLDEIQHPDTTEALYNMASKA